jgi:hypothetical protein
MTRGSVTDFTQITLPPAGSALKESWRLAIPSFIPSNSWTESRLIARRRYSSSNPISPTMLRRFLSKIYSFKLTLY